VDGREPCDRTVGYRISSGIPVVPEAARVVDSHPHLRARRYRDHRDVARWPHGARAARQRGRSEARDSAAAHVARRPDAGAEPAASGLAGRVAHRAGGRRCGGHAAGSVRDRRSHRRRRHGRGLQGERHAPRPHGRPEGASRGARTPASRVSEARPMRGRLSIARAISVPVRATLDTLVSARKALRVDGARARLRRSPHGAKFQFQPQRAAQPR